MIKLIKSENTNCYLVKNDGRNILIDAGTMADKKFLQKLKSEIALEQIDLLILTHGHYDHVGYASILQKEYGVKVAIHKNDFGKVSNGSMDFPKGKNIFSNFIRNATLRSIKDAVYAPFIPDIIIESDTITGYSELQIILLQGHTFGSIGIIFENNLFAGDLVMNMPFPSISWFAEDFNILHESIRKIRNLHLERIYPGHGNSFSYKWLRNI